MKKIYIFLTIFVILLLQISCSDIDNYPAPSEILTGDIIDAVTGKPMQTNLYDCMIQLEELSWSDNSEPQRFTTRQDGTFQNTKLFAGKYKITPVNGPFVPIEGIEVDVKATTNISFTVEPFLNVTLTDISKSNSSMTVKFKISSKSNLYKVIDARVFVNNSPFVGDGRSITQYTYYKDLKNMPNSEIFTTEHSITINEFVSGRKYYVRVGARSNDPISMKYNYSEIREIEF